MPQTITKTAVSLVKKAMAEVPAISVAEALPLLHSDSHVFIDLREAAEQRHGIIPGAVVSSRGLLEFHIDPESPAYNPAFNQDKTYIFYCASGGRSALAAKVAVDMGLSPVVNLSGGNGAWKAADGAIE